VHSSGFFSPAGVDEEARAALIKLLGTAWVTVVRRLRESGQANIPNFK
jgi:hypothetical protein